MKLQRLAPFPRGWRELSSKGLKCLAPIRKTPWDDGDELLSEMKRTHSEIEDRVYDLYGLTEDERRMVSQGNSVE